MLIAGAGMAGLVTAARARELGIHRVVLDGFDEALEWLVSLGPEVVWEDTPNPRTTGKRFEPRGLTEALLRAAGDVQTGQVLGTVIEDGRAGQAGTASLVGV